MAEENPALSFISERKPTVENLPATVLDEDGEARERLPSQ